MLLAENVPVFVGLFVIAATTVAQADEQMTITGDDDRFEAFKAAVENFNYSMNFSADPCNNFYEYACGNYQKKKSFTVLRENNYKVMAQQMESHYYAKQKTPKPLRQAVWFYNKCKDARANYADYLRNRSVIQQIVEDFSKSTGLIFTMVVNQTAQQPQKLDPEVLANALAILSRKGVDTLVSPMVDAEWLNPKLYKLYIDQSTLYYSKSYYMPKAWDSIKDSYMNDTVELMNRYAELLNIKLEQNILKHDVLKLLNFEVKLANHYSTNDSMRRRDMKRMCKTYNKNESYSFIDFQTYFRSLSRDWKALNDYFAKAPTWYIMEAEKLSALSTAFVTDNFDKTTVTNYLFYRLLIAFKDYLPKYKAKTKIALNLEPEFGRPRRPHTFGPTESVYDDVKQQCAYETLQLLQYANARFYIDYLYPTETEKLNLRKSMENIVASILNSFYQMLQQLAWVDEETMEGASQKITRLQQNYAYPDFIVDDQKLSAYYKDLDIDENDSYIEMKQKIADFNFILNYKVLLNDTLVDRSEFNGPPGTVNAWYTPELNSITFPAGILQIPFFDQKWPASLNFGGIGVVAGHELVHAFDDQGIQWNGHGALFEWMSEAAKNNFTVMADCVVREYDNFCPLKDSGMYPECINGDNTQGENIADNGGIQAAWKSYKEYVAMYGQDPQLPDDIIGRFSHDQLFFLSFAQVWCEKKPTNKAIYNQIMTDPHSPSIYRVLGAIQNFPAFRTAFNCPVDCVYAPKKHCSVWVPETD